MAGVLPCIWASVTCREYLLAVAGPMLLFDLVSRTTSESLVVCSISGRWRSNVGDNFDLEIFRERPRHPF